jgi:Flp pilus assembly protein TadB
MMPFGPSPGEQDRNLALFQAQLIANGGNTPTQAPDERSERLKNGAFLWTLILLAVVGVVTWIGDSTLATAVVAGLIIAVLGVLVVKRNVTSRDRRVDEVASPPRAQSP